MNRLLTFMTGLALLSVFPAAQAVTDTYTASNFRKTVSPVFRFSSPVFTEGTK